MRFHEATRKPKLSAKELRDVLRPYGVAYLAETKKRDLQAIFDKIVAEVRAGTKRVCE
jgi:hypothetical protein